jgi:hypothetical protein
MYVGNYAEKDAELTLELFKTLSREIKKTKFRKYLSIRN